MNTIIAFILWMSPELSRDEALEHATIIAAVSEEYRIAPELFVVITWHETRFQRHKIMRVGKKLYCGVMQVRAKDRDECDTFADLTVGYTAGALKYLEWSRYARRNPAATLRGYGCGFVRDAEGNVLKPARIMSACNGFDTFVINASKKLRAQALPAPTKYVPST